ncbi:RNA-directed DNA polymerase [Agrobacterium larrymoorei]|uniref:RNA-directed DNA polymerase n=1 Tax=Agrobacterium larrymoorei TaxID=160699 RepID=UPI0015731BFD|nr:RNA-directed DNA polymerase [Agrobacterium larrymoorei]NTJ41242.1 RNA-directed DNA polymerase [Agrobacterium larrymoorei]
MTAKTKSDRLRRLVSHGYFAPELPPCFVSEDLAKFRKFILGGIDALPTVQSKPAFYKYITEPSWFYFPRHKKDDRRHGVPNPISYLLLARTIAENYVDLRRKARRSGISASPPIFDWTGARALMRSSVDLRDDFRIDLSSRREEYVSADIRAFFHSIYTHAIPWAIYGKNWAKTNRGYQHYGNLIDLLFRNCQDGQTIGLPVGPDTSRLIAEVIASAVDQALREKIAISSQDASRYIDDYTLSAPNGESGDALIAALRQAASYFELELNNDKSAVFSTSSRQPVGWKQSVRASIPKGNPDYTEMQRFFYEIGRMCDAHPELNIEKFALQNARSALVRSSDWRRIQSHLVNGYRRNTSLVSFLVEIFILRQIEKGDVDLESTREFIEHRIPVLAQANRTGEIIWLLFLSIRLQVTLSISSVEPLFEIENPMIALLVSYAQSRGLLSGAVNHTVWNRSLNQLGLRGSMWLYAYESIGLGINPSQSATFIEQDQYFRFLQMKKVRFFAIEKGFASMSTTLRNLRGENNRMRQFRDDFFDDFVLDMDELEELDLEDLTMDDDLDY